MFRRRSADREAEPDKLGAVERLFAGSEKEQAEAVLEHLGSSLPGDVRGYVVVNEPEGYRFLAQRGYSPELLALAPQHGPWRDPGPRVVPNLIQELFTPNERELRSRLGELGLREPQASLVVPLGGEGGALVLHRHVAGVFDKHELSLAARWGKLLGQALQRQRALERSQRSLVEITRAFVEAHEAQDFAQLGHARRVTAYALALGRAVGLGAAQLQDLYFAAMLHDIGKLGASDFSDDDEEHPQRGANLVASSPALEAAVAAIRAHHERWDGSGFPDGLMGTAIPLLARIVAVADCYDALSSERGQALPLREAEKKLTARAQRDLDPELVSLFVNILRRGKATVDLAQLDGELLPFSVASVPATAP